MSNLHETTFLLFWENQLSRICKGSKRKNSISYYLMLFWFHQNSISSTKNPAIMLGWEIWAGLFWRPVFSIGNQKVRVWTMWKNYVKGFIPVLSHICLFSIPVKCGLDDIECIVLTQFSANWWSVCGPCLQSDLLARSNRHGGLTVYHVLL